MEPDTSLFRPATFIEHAMDNLMLALVIAGGPVLVAAAFLFEWRTVLIGLFTVPLSLVAAAFVLDLLGETFNAISPCGAGCGRSGRGRRRSRGRRERQPPRPRSQGGRERETATRDRPAGLSGSAEPPDVRDCIALLAVVPVAAMGGRPGVLREPLVLAYALAVLAAMVVATVVTPALSLLLFARGRAGVASLRS